MLSAAIYTEVPEYYHSYLRLLESENFKDELTRSREISLDLFKMISPDLENFSYDKGKWTVNEVLQHITDTEKIFAYRALRFSRKDATDLKGFDENLFARNFPLSQVPFQDIVEDYVQTRLSTDILFKNMTDEMLDFSGSVNSNLFSARHLAYLISGHNLHHCQILKERYF